MGRNTETPWSTETSSPRQRKLASFAMLLGYSLFLLGFTDPAFSLHSGGPGGFYCLEATLLQVGDAFREPTALQELNTIGSAPPQDHVFKVGNFVALRSIQRQLQEKIFAIEGKWEHAPAVELNGLLPCSPDSYPYLQVTPNLPHRAQASNPISFCSDSS